MFLKDKDYFFFSHSITSDTIDTNTIARYIRTFPSISFFYLRLNFLLIKFIVHSHCANSLCSWLLVKISFLISVCQFSIKSILAVISLWSADIPASNTHNQYIPHKPPIILDTIHKDFRDFIASVVRIKLLWL